jgi:hypothetical protein
MPADEFTLKLSTLMGFFVVLSLFISWYFRRDTMVRPCRPIYAIPEQRYTFLARCYPNRRVL